VDEHGRRVAQRLAQPGREKPGVGAAAGHAGG
jgi:hypothetical protein